MLDDKSIPVLTKIGKQELNEPGTMLTSPQLEVLVIIDGYSSVAQTIKRARHLTPDAVRATIKELIDRKFVSVNADPSYNAIDPGNFFTMDVPAATDIGAGEHSHTEIDADTEFLRRHGYYVNMARRPAVRPDHADGRKLEVLVIDDDPDISKVLRICLNLENLDTRIAANRDEIVSALRLAPLPDLVLLDVRLPGINGFDILARMRQHPALKEIPVVMITAEATREAVLKGILGGADGFITKPFQIHPLVRTVKTVLGLKLNPND